MKIEMPRADQFPIVFKVKSIVNNEYLTDGDIEEITMTCRLKPMKESPILFQKKLSEGTIIFDKESNQVVIKMLKEDTKDLKYGTYGFDIEIKIGDIISTKVGTIKITKEYTM